MCEFFSCIVTRDLKVFFCELDSHEDIIKRTGSLDDTLKNRNFVRLEILKGEMKNYKVDEQGTLPDWYHKNEVQIKEKCKRLVLLVKFLRDAYDALVKFLRDAYDALVKFLRDAYDALVKSLRDAYIKELSKIDGYV